jgi:hypothetical protein
LSKVGILFAVAGGSLLLAGIGIHFWTLIPPSRHTESLTVAGPSGDPESLQLIFGAPDWLRARTVERIDLTLKQDNSAGGGAAWIVLPELHSGGASILPGPEQGTRLGPGERAEFHWSIVAIPGAAVPIETSVRIRLPEGSDASPIWARSLRLEVVDFAGLGAPAARTAAGRAMLVGVVCLLLYRRLRDR